ncbi:MAG: DUF2283 domain-containing protein [Patescibacteria group bacterium]
MHQKRSKIRYDCETKILSIRLTSNKSVDSDVYDNVVVDYDMQGKPVNIDIMAFSIADFRRIPNPKKLIGAAT